ncbi:MAG: molybdopterin-dependent oxidoreductase [Kineosporiaceae bacterium]
MRADVPARLSALIGMAAGLVALAGAQLLSLIVGATSAPLPAVADAAVDLMPDAWREAGIGWFGRNDKAALLVIALAVVLALCALAGVLAARSLPAGSVVVVALACVAGIAASTRPDASAGAAVPTLLGAIAGLVTLHGLTGMALAAHPGAPVRTLDPEPASQPVAATDLEVPDDARPGPARRGVLRAASLTAVAGGTVAVAGALLARLRHASDDSRAAVRLPDAVDAPPAASGEEFDVRGLAPRITPNDDFYRIDTAFLVPRLTTAGWRLRVHGMVARELTLTWDDLLARDLVDREITMACVSNPVGGDLVGTARWRGALLAPLLREAGPTAGADMVLSTSDDGWTCSTPLADLLDGRDAMLAVGMNGEPLPLEHGFPVRMVVPGLYGFVSGTKWVTDLRVTRFDRDRAYWTDRGWSARGPIKTSSRIDVPADGVEVPAGAVTLAGVAWAPHRGVAGVEVQVDEGSWTAASLGADGGPDVWRQWRASWNATPGKHRLRVRATDGQGRLQVEARQGAVPDGATGWHEVYVTVT